MRYFSRLKSALSSLRKDNNGNIAVISALVCTPVIALACGSVDIIRVTSTEQRLQSLLDSATLAAAALTNNNAISTTASDYILTNTPSGSPWDTLTYSTETLNDSINIKKVKISASVTVDTPFLSLIGHKESVINAESVAIQSVTNIEISMILDISSSMHGNKISSLRTAAKDFFDIVLNDLNKAYTSINLILFGGSVNIGHSLQSRYENSLSTSILNPSESDYYVKGEEFLFPSKSFLFSGGPNCIEYVADDYDLNDIPLASRAQLPNFTRYSSRNDWCPRPDTESMFNTNNIDKLKDRIDAMTLSDGTGMDIGTMWGAKALSPDLRGVLGGDFTDRPAAFDDEGTMKIAIIMTDGEITPQFRPRDPDHATKVHTGHKNDRQIIVAKGNKNTKTTSDNYAVAYFKRMCDDMKDNGIYIFTIGFNINKAKISDHLLSYCASSPSDYKFVEGLDLKKAFNSIAVSVNSLRVSG